MGCTRPGAKLPLRTALLLSLAQALRLCSRDPEAHVLGRAEQSGVRGVVSNFVNTGRSWALARHEWTSWPHLVLVERPLSAQSESPRAAFVRNVFVNGVRRGLGCYSAGSSLRPDCGLSPEDLPLWGGMTASVQSPAHGGTGRSSDKRAVVQLVSAFGPTGPPATCDRARSNRALPDARFTGIWRSMSECAGRIPESARREAQAPSCPSSLSPSSGDLNAPQFDRHGDPSNSRSSA
ncbi:hypothetical protein OBBRIDRAFT_551813 [Obba rivulosa]|uniref:Uncharacterized protein n=1 Tax=Obba rivulosa TaxID=1052685 RepID=A0A8E2B408_9APHY|nr:hypothetical protein OBBRIDRAFT_551813 [Obba rivulosa]